MRAALPEDIGHDFSEPGRAFDEKHPDAIESWRPGPDVRCVAFGRPRGITVRLHSRSLVDTGSAIHWTLV